jgi:hypothetical protein
VYHDSASDDDENAETDANAGGAADMEGNN